MDTKRQQKINSLLQKDLGDIFLHDVKIPNALITVTRINITSDMSIARVNLSIYGTSDKESILKNIKSKTSEIRGFLGSRIKNQIRIVPVLQFFIDDTLDRAERIEQLLS